jgi:FlaG/FlaF family flagellin (archaellin)
MRTAVLVCVAILVVAEATLASTVTPGNSITVNMAGGTSVKVSVPSDGVNSVEVNPSGGQPPTHVDIVVNGSGGKVKVEVDEEDDAEIPRDELKIHVIVNGDNNEIRIEGGTRTGDAETTLTYTNSSSAGADGNTTYLGACKPEGRLALRRMVGRLSTRAVPMSMPTTTRRRSVLTILLLQSTFHAPGTTCTSARARRTTGHMRVRAVRAMARRTMGRRATCTMIRTAGHTGRQ